MGNLDLIIAFIAPEPTDYLILIGDDISKATTTKLKQLFNIKAKAFTSSELYHGKTANILKKNKSIIYYIEDTIVENIINLLQIETKNEMEEMLVSKFIINDFNNKLILNTSNISRREFNKFIYYLDQNSQYFNYLIQEEFIAIITY